MKRIRTLLALLLCLCMLPLSAFAYSVEPGGAHTAVSYTPAESGLYAVSVSKDGETLSPLPAKTDGKAVYDPALTVSVTAGEAAAQAVDYNVFYLSAGTAYTVLVQNISNGAYDDSGEWDVSVSPVKPTALALNADTLTEGEWFSYTPAKDGSFTLSAAPAPVFVEVLTAGAESGDWAGYALDKERCRAAMELDYLRSLKAAMAARQEALDQAEDTYNKALDKLDNYNKLNTLANDTNMLGTWTNVLVKKQTVYDALKSALGSEGTSSLIGRLFPNLNLPTIDKEIVDEMPADVAEFPDWLSARLQSSEGLVGEAKAKYDEQKAQQDADQARYDAGIAANPQLEALVDDTSVETAALRQQVKTDADAILSGARSLAAGDSGMKLVAADWLNTEDGSLTVALEKGKTYVVHALSNLTTSASITDGAETPDDPPAQTVDKTALEKAISDAKAVDTEPYTAESVAAMNAALADAEAVQADADATQAEVDAAAKALNDAVKALEKQQGEPTDPPVQPADKTALEQAIADAKAVETDKYTDESVSAMNAALADAETVQADADATQAEVDAAAKALNDAVKALKEKPVDKTALQAAIDAAGAVDRDQYTDASLGALDLALAAARIVNLNPLAKQEHVDEVTQALNDALDALEPKPAEADKTALQSAVDAAKAVDRSKYTEESLAAMDSALSAAESTLSDALATQADVDNAAKTLNDAVAALKEKPVTPAVDKSALEQAISAAEAVDTTKYTSESVAAMTSALSSAKTVRDNAAATQTEVDNAANALNSAVAALKEKPASTVDKTALQQAVDAAKAIDRDKYTEASLAALDTQLQNAEAALQNADLTQTAVNLAARRLNNAIAALQEKPVPQKTKFVDVPDDAYYAAAVDWAVENNVTNGTDATHFSPKNNCTRAQIVTFLWRVNGEPKVSAANPFTDVRPGAYYYDAVLWAVKEGITTGTSKTTFSPSDTCTRAQAVTFLWRMEGQPEPDVTSAGFVDVRRSDYFADAVLWAVGKDITKGTDATHFSPKQTCSRAQIVTFLYRDKVGA